MSTYTQRDLEQFYDGYTREAVADINLDVYAARPSANDVPRGSEDKLVADCKRFLDRAWPLLDVWQHTMHMRDLGHDFYRMRNELPIFSVLGSVWNTPGLAKLAFKFGHSRLYLRGDRIEVA